MKPRRAIVVVLLAATLLASGCSATGGIPDPSNLPKETTSTNIYFSTGRTLVEEERVVDGSQVYKATLEQLLAAKPQRNTQIAIVQPTARVLGVTLKDGTATIDWSADVLKFDAEPKEQILALGSVLVTMGQFPEVKRVRFSVEGKTSGTVGGKDVERFWGEVNLKAQPWDVLRTKAAAASAAASVTTGSK